MSREFNTCRRCHHIGRMSYPRNLLGDQASASTYVCDREDHQRAAAAWVYEITGHLGEFVPFTEKMVGAR